MMIAAVLPCYRVARHIEAVLRAIPPAFSRIVVVDDACPEGSGDVAAAVDDPRITVIRRPVNGGVGAAMADGYRAALALGADICVKIDGDGQMDPADAVRLTDPLAQGAADYAKGNRFRDFRALAAMPPVRLFGNSLLSFLVKAASGYWTIMDPTNGFTAIHRRVLEQIDLDRLDRGYFFECDLLSRLYLVDAVVLDVALPARYGDETSSLSVARAAGQFPAKLARAFLRRLVLRYFIQDFNMASVYLLLAVPMLGFGLVAGSWEWLRSVESGQVRSAGTVMLVAMPVILGLQLLLQAVAVDIAAVPKRKS
jgi:glycosyltransferase involved in cell wall biosynthesis